MSESKRPYFNRELSWLEFNQRVLDEARDGALPLLERLRFLAIVASNLDEFFMVRVGGLQLLSEAGERKPDPSGMTPDEQLEAVSARAHRMAVDQYAMFSNDIEPKLADAGIRRADAARLNERQSRAIGSLFDAEIVPTLSPIAVPDDGAFPLLVNQALNLAVRVKNPDGVERRAIIPFRRGGSRFVTVAGERGYAFILFEDVVARFVERFFPGEQIVEASPFRITRNADLSLQEEQSPDLLAEMAKIVEARKVGDCVRLEIAQSASEELVGWLRTRLEVGDREVFRTPGPIDLSAFMHLCDLPGYEALRNEPWAPQESPQAPAGESMFATLAKRDVLLVHPYQSFDPVVRLIEEAALDPDVLAIKQTLYRTSRTSPIVAALARAAQRGKYVTAIVELKARFDEARNIEWARALEQAGVQVIYGIKGLKTHAKICIVVRREPHGVQRYVHFGTGNYNEATAKIYSDVSLLTANEEFGADAVAFFNAITGYSQPPRYHKLAAAPLGLRGRLLEMIEAERRRREEGEEAAITAKLNSLVDPELIDALYAAAQAGVKVRLNVRGICCLKPGVKGVSDKVEVVSVIDRFLEHARVIAFHHGGDERVFISSADWMPRNLDKRIELLVPIEDADMKRKLLRALETYFEDNVKASKLGASGEWKRIKPTGRRKPLRSQEELFRRAKDEVRENEQGRRTMFEPHRAPGADPQ